MPYLLYADVTDVLVQSFGQTAVEAYFTEVDNEINDLAEQMGVEITQIDTDYKDTGRIHYKVIRFGVAYLCYRMLYDKAGLNENELSPENDKYYRKGIDYKHIAGALRGEITANMFTDTVTSTSDRAAYSAVMVRS